MASERPTGTAARRIAVKYDAAATGSAISCGLPSPAWRAASVSSRRRCSPHRAGWVSRTCSGAPPSCRRASAATACSTPANTFGTGSSCPPSSTTPSSMRRLGLGSNRLGSTRACRSASRPTSICPSGVRYTAVGISGAPSNSSGRRRPSGIRSMDTVLEVPKSMPSTRMSVTLLCRVTAMTTGKPTATHRSPRGVILPVMIARRYAYLDTPTPIAFAHRGGAALAGENTMAAFARAVELGYRYIETDTHATADGVAVVFHDHTLARIAGRPGRIRQLPWAELSRVRVDGQPVVPRLSGALDRVLLASFSDARTARMRAVLGPGVATSLGSRGAAQLWAASRAGRGAARLATRVAAAQVPYRQGPVRVVDERFVRYAHGLGLQVHVWTVDAPDRMNELLDLGVDGIMTDRIDVLREVYTARGCWPA